MPLNLIQPLHQKTTMPLNVILTGSTGMIGKSVLLECIDNPDISSVLVINRKESGMKHLKIREIVHADFNDFSGLRGRLQGYDACFFCLGVSSAGMNETAYHKITYDITTKFALHLLKENTNMVFCYISGAGTDSSEKGRIMWARVKGKTENALLAMPFKACYMFRPGYIQPLRGIRSRTPSYNAFYSIMKPLYPLLKLMGSWVTNTETLAKAMIRVVMTGYPKKILENKDINIIGGPA